MAITKVGESQSFAYTGDIQQFTVPMSGIYELYLTGASGGAGAGNNSVGNGGITKQYVELKKDTVLYVVVGGTGGFGSGNCTYAAISASGGYNGGGSLQYGGDTRSSLCTIAGGGGATHIATMTGLLKDLSNNRDNILAVAGGGGGHDHFEMYWYEEWVTRIINGGSGGGLSSDGTYPATQTDGYAFGYSIQGGGGGLYGGKSPGANDGQVVSGGSGYLSDSTTTYNINGTIYSSTTVTNGVGSGGVDGSAIITLMKKACPTAYLGDKEIDAIYLGDTAVEDTETLLALFGLN